MRGGPSFYVEHRLKQLSGLGDYPEECRKRRLRDILGRSRGGATPRARKRAHQYDRMSFIAFPL